MCTARMALVWVIAVGAGCNTSAQSLDKRNGHLDSLTARQTTELRKDISKLWTKLNTTETVLNEIQSGLNHQVIFDVTTERRLSEIQSQLSALEKTLNKAELAAQANIKPIVSVVEQKLADQKRITLKTIGELTGKSSQTIKEFAKKINDLKSREKDIKQLQSVIREKDEAYGDKIDKLGKKLETWNSSLADKNTKLSDQLANLETKVKKQNGYSLEELLVIVTIGGLCIFLGLAFSPRGGAKR